MTNFRDVIMDSTMNVMPGGISHKLDGLVCDATYTPIYAQLWQNIGRAIYTETIEIAGQNENN